MHPASLACVFLGPTLTHLTDGWQNYTSGTIRLDELYVSLLAKFQHFIKTSKRNCIMRHSRSSLEYQPCPGYACSGWHSHVEQLSAVAPSQSTKVHLRGINVTDISWNHSEDCFAWNTKIIHSINIVCHCWPISWMCCPVDVVFV